MKIINYLKYSGITITLRLNPFHWRVSCAFNKTNEVWTQDIFVIELLMFTVRAWVDDGEW
jgi:hypothetical protein